jgi:hypothetical protein
VVTRAVDSIKFITKTAISKNTFRHSCEGRNPEKYWIPGQARNDRLVFHVAILITALVNPSCPPFSKGRIVPLFGKEGRGEIFINSIAPFY